MKKKIVQFMILVFAIGFAAYTFGWVMGESFDPTDTYTAPARVIEVDEATGWVTFADWAGEAWCIRGDNYFVDELVVITFNNNNTETIYDDLIVEVNRYTVEEVE